MARFLLLHGLGGVGPDHWLVWLSQELRDRGHLARMRKLPKPSAPVLDDWLAAMTERLVALGDDDAEPSASGRAEHLAESGDRSGELVVVAHSLGGRLWLHHAQRARPDLPVADRVVLVAPPKLPEPSGEHAGNAFFELDRNLAGLDLARVARHTRAVVSTNDHFWPGGGAIPGLIEPLGLPVDVIGNCGHVEPQDGFGPWPGMLAWCLGEAETVTR